MKNMKEKIAKVFKYVVKNKYQFFILLVILFSFLANAFHTQFPDEFDNIYGGFLINEGKLPYTGFFSHHNPGAYYFASLITLFTQRSFVWFRIIFALVLFLFYAFSYFFLKKRIKSSLSYFLCYGLFIGFGATYWWGQMLLSETLVGYMLVPVFLLIIEKNIRKIPLDFVDFIFISVLTFLSLFVSLTYVYLVPIIVGVSLYQYFSERKKYSVRKILMPFLILAVPYLLFLMYLFATKSIGEFYFASITYNTKYYIYNFPKVAGTISRNPARYAISIARTNFDQLFSLLTQVKNFNFSTPLNISLGVGIAGLVIYLFAKKKISLMILVAGMFFYTNARSEPLNLSETDFHSTVYIMCTAALSFFLLFNLKDELNREKKEWSEKLILSGVFLTLLIYWTYNTYFLTNQFAYKVYQKVMGQAPLIYDRSQTASTLNKLLFPNDYYWIGPFELQELLFVKGKIASRYFWYLPASSKDAKIRTELISDLEKNKPKVIVFKKWWANFGVAPKDFNGIIVDYLDKDYFQISDLEREGMHIKVNVAKELDFDFAKEYYFDKNRKEEIINLMLEKGLIELI